jgi:hypothetical protein
VAGPFAVSADDFAARATLGCEGSGRCLESLLFAIANKVLFILDCSNDGVGGKWGIFVGVTNHWLQVRVVLAEGIYEEGGAEMIAVEWTNGENSSMEGVEFFNDMWHSDARAEMSVERFGDQGDLGVGAEVLMTFAQASKDGGGSGKVGDDLIIGARDVLKNECL